jgi:FkbM family methyltransferase
MIMKALICKILRLYIRYFPVRKAKIPLLGLFERMGVFHNMELNTSIGNHTRVLLSIDDWVQRLVYFFGVYEFEKTETAMWIDYAKRSNHILDIGSNFGYYSLLASDVNPGSKIMAFEPAPAMFQRLTHNLNLNAYLNVMPLNLGLSNEKGRFDFFVADNKHSGMSGLSMPDGIDGQKIQVEITTVDQILADHGDVMPDLIKIDVEGNELNALLGMKHMFSVCKPVFFIEIYDRNLAKFGHSRDMVFDFFKDQGYSIMEVGTQNRLVHIDQPKDIGLAICIPN